MTPTPVLRRGAVLAAALALSACAGQDIATTRVDARNDRTPVGMGLDNRDFKEAAGKMAQQMISSGRMNRPDGGRYVLAMSRITNDTQLHLSTAELTQKVRMELNNSGKVITTTAVGLGGPEDPLAMQARQLRHSAEFNQRTVAGRGQLSAPDLSLTGRIIQRNNRVDGGGMRIDYLFQLTVTDIRTGLAFWEGEETITRHGSARTVSW